MDKLKKVVITGATGLIGSRLIEVLQQDFEFISLTSEEMDITNKQAVDAKLDSLEFDLFLHLAAYTNVDKAETEKQVAYAINVEGTKNVLDATIVKNAQFMYISTGFVFDGTTPPYDENSIPHPVSYYGETKYNAEELVKDKGMIIRLEYPYGISPAPKKDFAHTIKSLLEQGKELQMVTDSLMTPTYIDDFVYALKHLILNFSPEIYHIVGSMSLSPYDAGVIIAKTFSLDESLIKPTTYKEYFNGKAHRPQFAEIKSNKNNFYTMKPFNQGIQTL